MITQVKLLGGGGTSKGRKRENERKRRKSERQRVAKKGFGVRYKFNCWSNFSGLKTDNPWELISGLLR